MDESVKMVLAVCHLFEDLKATHLSGPTPMSFADKQCRGIAWAHSEAITKKMQHVNIREVAVRDSICLGKIKLSHIPGELNPSDLVTKEMKDKNHFFNLRACHMSPCILGLGVSQGGARIWA
jgi:hypothetical protein